MAFAAVGFALLGWQVPAIATAVFGLPVLFGIYLRDINLLRSLPARYLVLAAVVAVGFGVAWSLIAGPVVAEAYSAALGGQLGARQFLLCGVAIPITFGLALVAPTALVRVLNPRGEALDGFTIGALSAVVVNAAAAATQLEPQVAMALTVGNQPVTSLLSEAVVEGVAWPLGSLATGGVFGLALWFRPKESNSWWYRRSTVVPAALLGALTFTVAMGVVDVAPLRLSLYLALQLLIALGAVLAVRTVIADALLNEAHGESAGGQMVCAECENVVAAMPFCSHCGLATHAQSRTSRAASRVASARAGQTGPADEPAAVPRRPASYLNVLGPVAVGVGVTVAAAMVVAALMKPAPAAYVCPPNCGRPPLGNPVETNPRFSGDGGAFSVAYPGEGSAYEITLDPPGIKGVQARYVGGDTGILMLFGEPARGRAAKQVVQDVLKSKFPGSTVDYEIPNASVGYESGYGVVADVYPRDASSTFSRTRVIVMAAVRHDYALIATAAGPYHEYTPHYGTGHPSGANLEVAMDMGKYVNSFRWFGDRYRRPS